VIEQSRFPVEPWVLRETRLDLAELAQSESVFALSNGHIGLRGNLDEGEPYGIPGTYLNSFYELRPLPYAEAGYGYPESGQTIVNVTNGKVIRLLVDDEPFDVRYGEVRHHERVLDLRAGTLTRTVEWVSPAGRAIRVRSRRHVSFTQRAVAAIEYEVEALDGPARLIIQSELVANEVGAPPSADPRVSAVLTNPLQAEHHEVDDQRRGAILLHSTRHSELSVAAAMGHDVSGPGRVEVSTTAREDWARTTIVARAEPGQPVRLTKYLAYGWSSQRSRPSLVDQVAGALVGARYTGIEGLLAEQRDYLDDFWASADVIVEGDNDIQQAVRFGLFHVLQAGARAERRAIAAKGLTGPGYDGHSFWDTEAFVLPVLTYTQPDAALDALRWRASILDVAKDRAETLGLAGAAFPWRTIRGEECSSYWPAGTAAMHINADIAEAIERHRLVTGDDTFTAEHGLGVLVETARLWMSLGHHDRHGAWHIDGVTGPDEYTAVCDDNVFTNLMAARNLAAAAGSVIREPDGARAYGVTMEEVASWRDAARDVYLPYDEQLGVHPQCAGFTDQAEWDFGDAREEYPLLLHRPYFELYRKQVVKQADLLLAMHWCGDKFTPEQKARNVDYYERRTVRDSSLSACTQAVLAAEVGQLELAHDYAYEAALIDLRDIHHNSKDGLHIASLAGAWLALVAGFGGLRDHDGVLSFDPQLPQGIGRLCFLVRWQGLRLQVDVHCDQVTYALFDGDDGRVQLQHGGELVEVTTAKPVTIALHHREPLLAPPVQPAGRAPAHRRGQATLH